MKFKHVALLMMVVLLPLVLGGCFGKTWSVSFGNEANFDDWVPSGGGDPYQVVPGVGVRLNGSSLSSPVAFDEDFTVSVLFTLNVELGETAYFGFYIGDGQGWSDNLISNFYSQVGAAGSESWWVEDIGTGGSILPVNEGSSTIPGILRKGPNVWKMIKTGEVIKIYMNFSKIAEYTMTKCDALLYYINFYSYLYGGDVLFNRVNVQYKGSIIV